MVIENYYNTLQHLRMAKPYTDDIKKLNACLLKYRRKDAINLLSKLNLKYETPLNQISFYLSGRPIIKGEVNELYREYSDEQVVDDINYLIECIIIIASVKLRLCPDLDTILDEIAEDYENEYDEDEEYEE